MTLGGSDGNAPDGNSVVKFFGNQDGTQPGAFGSRIDQTSIAIDAAGLGRIHTLSFFGELGGGSGTVEITATVFDDNGVVIGQSVKAFSSAGYEQRTLTFTPTTSTIDLRFQNTGLSTVRDPYMDLVSITYVIPAPPALLDLAALQGYVMGASSRRRLYRGLD